MKKNALEIALNDQVLGQLAYEDSCFVKLHYRKMLAVFPKKTIPMKEDTGLSAWKKHPDENESGSGFHLSLQAGDKVKIKILAHLPNPIKSLPQVSTNQESKLKPDELIELIQLHEAQISFLEQKLSDLDD